MSLKQCSGLIPGALRLSQIIESVSGKLELAECINYPTSCGEADHCRLRDVFIDINKKFHDSLDSYTLDDFSNGRIAGHDRLE